MKLPSLLKFVFAMTTTAIMNPTIADARPSTRSFTCEGVRNYIHARGAVVMNTKNSSVYRRFVSNVRFCQHGEGTVYYSAPTRSGKCRLKICKEIDYEDLFWNPRR